MNNTILIFIKEISETLCISAPETKIDKSLFRSPTQLALYHNDIIYLSSDLFTPDIAFSICHELRHVWQIKNKGKSFFSNYRELGEISVDEYNLQPVEIDANAFAVVVMSELFHIKPQFKGFSESVKQAIFEAAKHITL